MATPTDTPSAKALEQRAIQPSRPKMIEEGPYGLVRRLDWDDLDDEGIPAEKRTHENLNRANFRRLTKDLTVIRVTPLSMGRRGDPRARTIDRRPQWLYDREDHGIEPTEPPDRNAPLGYVKRSDMEVAAEPGLWEQMIGRVTRKGGDA